jgi:membrane protease YdiL (CAAX protease family)
MGPWLAILILAVIFAVLGFAGIANWLFIVAVVLVVAGLVMAIAGRASRL